VGDWGYLQLLLTSTGIAQDIQEFRIELPEVFQLLHCPGLPLLGREVLLHHLPYHGRAVKGLEKVIVLLVLQLLQDKVSLCKVQQPSDLGFGTFGNVTKVMIDLQHDIRCELGGQFTSGELHRFMLRSVRSI